MASDFNKPAIADNYSTGYTQAIIDNQKALAQGLDPAVVTPSNHPTNAIRWNSVNKYWEKYNGTSWAALESLYGISISGNAATATKWATGRTVALTGDITGTSGAFDGSGNLSFATTLPTVNANVGSFGGAASVASVTVNAKGQVTAASSTSIAIAWSQITSGKPTTLSGYGITDAAASSHSHGNITNAGAIGTTASLPIITTTSGVLTTGSFGTTAGTFCQGNDSRIPASAPYAWALAASKPTYTAAEVGSDAAGTARPASDVYAWAKAASKPTYTYSEVGAAASSHTHSYTSTDTGALGVGCFALLTMLADFTQGTTYAGSSLYTCTLYSGGQTQVTGNYNGASTLSGTWRAMATSATNTCRIGIFQRIS